MATYAESRLVLNHSIFCQMPSLLFSPIKRAPIMALLLLTSHRRPHDPAPPQESFSDKWLVIHFLFSLVEMHPGLLHFRSDQQQFTLYLKPKKRLFYAMFSIIIHCFFLSLAVITWPVFDLWQQRRQTLLTHISKLWVTHWCDKSWNSNSTVNKQQNALVWQKHNTGHKFTLQWTDQTGFFRH